MKTAVKYLKPLSTAEAVQIANECGNDFRYLAGGTDALVNKFLQTDEPVTYIDITGVEELTKIASEQKHISIGSLTTLHELCSNDQLAREFPVIRQTALQIASPVIRKTATIGGNLLCQNRCIFYNQSEWWRQAAGYCLKCKGDICIATGGSKNCFSKFSSDMAITLIALGAEAEVQGDDEVVTLKIEDLYSSNGIDPVKLSPNKIIRRILIPRVRAVEAVFKKLRPRRSLEFSSLSTAGARYSDGKIRLVLGGIDPGPVSIEINLPFDPQPILQKLVKKARTVDNDVYSRTYRREIALHFLNECLRELKIGS